MSEGFLLSRVLLRFDAPDDEILSNLSAITLTPDGSLWLGSDEGIAIERLSPLEPNLFGSHQSFNLGNFLPLVNQKDEIDIEGLDYCDHYLWMVGSHSLKRKKPKGEDPKTDIGRLKEIKKEPNRYLLARIPVDNGQLMQSFSPTDGQNQDYRVACLPLSKQGNPLTDALKNDEHLGIYIKEPIPSKENGFDVEGLAVHYNKIFLGLRGPVLRGFAIILELDVEEKTPSVLALKKFPETGLPYRKHFFELNGLGIRELCIQGEDLIILSGPTMDLDGIMKVFRWKNALTHSGDTINYQSSPDLQLLFHIPFYPNTDHAEGLELISFLGQVGLLVAYDSPNPNRILSHQEVFVDIFRLL